MEEKIFNARKEAGFTQEALAKKMKVSASTISAWETGKSEPSDKELEKLEKILGISVEEDGSFKTAVLDVLSVIFIAILIIVPGIYLISQTMDAISGYSVILNAVGNITDDMIKNYGDSVLQRLVIIYGWYSIANIANYIFYKMKHKPALSIVLIVETIIFALSIVFIASGYSVLEPVLFVIPVITGVFQYALIKVTK